MPRWKIEYTKEFYPSPLSFWVHKALEDKSWFHATKYNPALPKAIPCKGYPVLFVDVSGVELWFSSVQEVEHFLAVISQKNLPSSRQLSQKQDQIDGPNRHWLSRLPGKLKSWKKREKLIPIIEAGLQALKKVMKKHDK